MRLFRLASSILLMVMAIPLARADATSALTRGQRAFDVQRYDEAIEAFQEAYLLDPRPELLYALGQAQRNAKHCASAIESYRRFLRSSPQLRQAEAARLNIERCEASLANVVPAPAAPPVREPMAATPAPVNPPREQPFSRPAKAIPRSVGASLIGIGGASLVAGTALALVARARVSAPGNANSYAEFAAASPDASSAVSWQGAGLGVALTGAALLVSGAVVLGISLHRAHRSAR